MTTTLLSGEAVVDAVLGTITRSDTDGSWITDGVRTGHIITTDGFVEPENNLANMTVLGVDTTVITTDASLVSETSTTSTTYTITPSSISPESTTSMGITIDALRAANGTASLPSVSFKNQPDMGLYVKRADDGAPIAGNHLHFAIDGARAFRIMRGGTLRVNSSYFAKVAIQNDVPNKRYVDQWNINAQIGTAYTPIFDANTFVDGDLNKVITLDNAGAITLTVPLNSTANFPVGSRIIIIAEGAGTVTFAPEGVVVIDSLSGNLDIEGQYGVAMLLKKDTNVWNLSGDLA